VLAAERIACIDQDGCLWSKQPMNVPLRFGFDRLRGQAPQQQHWWSDPLGGPRSRGGSSAAIAGGQKAILKILRLSHAGMTSEEFAAIVADWIGTARHPSTGRLTTQMVDQQTVAAPSGSVTSCGRPGPCWCAPAGGGLHR
jgi:hypothetical protein